MEWHIPLPAIKSIKLLDQKIVACTKCPRLVQWREEVAVVKRKSYENELPKEIVWRKNKIGFEIPQNNWHDGVYSFMNKFPTYKEFDFELYNKAFNVSSLSLFL